MDLTGSDVPASHRRTTIGTQQETLTVLSKAGLEGATWREVADRLNLHHGQASGALSKLHQTGRIARLKERRLKCKVYVLPEYLYGRPTEEYRTRSTATTTADAQAVIQWLADEAGNTEQNVVYCGWASFFANRARKHFKTQTQTQTQGTQE